MPDLVSTATPPTRAWAGLTGTLNRDWEAVWSHRSPTAPDGSAWAGTCPALAGCATVGEVLERIRCGTPSVHDQVLHGLLSMHSQEDQLAGRTVLQTMLGRLARMTRTAAARGLDDPPATALEALWKAIATYPLHRRQRVPANLALEALAAMAPARDCLAELPAGDLLEDHLQAAHTANRVPPAAADRLDDATYTLTWAYQRAVLTEAEARLLARVHLAETRPALAQVAAELNCSYAAVRQRHSVAVNKLATSVRRSLSAAQAS